MKISVIDTETSGLETTDQIVELAVVTGALTKGKLSETPTCWVSLVKPTIPISLGARATHHISDEDLLQAPPAAALQSPDFGSVVIAHNLEFDVRMMEQSGLGHLLPQRRICTWRCGMHLYPQAASHSNQHLRYALDLPVPEPLPGPPHRALPDAVITWCLLEHMLRTHTIEQLEELTTRPALLVTCNIGKFRGRPWSEVDRGMLSWVLGKDFSADVHHTARHWLQHGNGKAA